MKILGRDVLLKKLKYLILQKRKKQVAQHRYMEKKLNA
jgi:hypothetical protein